MTTISVTFPTYILGNIGDYKTFNSLKVIVAHPDRLW